MSTRFSTCCRRPDVAAVSIKASALVANLDVLDFDRSVERISEPLREIYRAALAKMPHGFVNLDMEEYRDLELTVAAFTQVLDEPEFDQLEAGIVLQAYSRQPRHARHLGEWAAAAAAMARRHQDPDRKGANLARVVLSTPSCTTDRRPYPTKPTSMRATS